MADTKKYYIEINGIKESVDAVDSLLKKLENLEQRIDALNQKGIKVEGSGGSSGGSSKKLSELSAEEKLQKQLFDTEEKRMAMQEKSGREHIEQLQNEKQLIKEINAEAKATAALDRYNARKDLSVEQGGYDSSTMLGMKTQLADIKAAMQSMEVGSEEFVKATQRANELNEALKKIEETYGQYGRNVGNYAGSIADALGAMDGITIKIGEQEVKFNSTKEAMRTMKENLKQMIVEGRQGEKAYDDTIKALHELEMALQEADSAINDVKASSQGMDTALDWMQSFGAMGQITQGFSAFFGNTGFEETIQKLMSLQSVLQGIEQLRKQMNTGEGFGGMFAKSSKAVDTFVAKLTGAKVGMNGLEASTKTATIAVKGLSIAIKGILSLGIMLAIDKVIEGLQKLSSVFTGAKNSAAESIRAIDLVSSELEEQNKILDNRKKEIDLMQEKGLIDAQEAERLKIEATNETLKQQIELLGTIARLNSDDDVWENVNDGMKNFASSENSIFNPETYEKTKKEYQSLYNAFISGLNAYEEKIEEGNGTFADHAANVMSHLGLISGTSEDVKKAFVANTQQMVGQFIAAGRQIISHTGEWTEQEKKMFQNVLDTMNDPGFLKSVLMNLPAYLGDQAAALQPVVDDIKAQLRSIGLSSNLNVQLTTDEQAKQLSEEQKAQKKLAQLKIDAIKDSGERQRAQLRYNMQEELKQYKSGSEEYNLTVQKYQNQINDTYKKGGAKRVSTAKHTSKQTLDVEKEKSRLEIELMSEGLKKRIAQLNKQRDEELKKVKGHKELELRVNQLYDKKILDERKKYADETKKIYEDLYRNILDMTINNLQGQLDLMDDELDNRLKRMYDRRPITIFSGVSEMFTGSLDSEQMNWVSEFSALLKQSDEFTSKLQNAFNKGLDTTEIENQLDALGKRLNDLQKKYDEKGWWKVFGLDSHEIVSYFRNFDSTFQESTDSFVDYMNKTKAFWNKYINEIKKNIDDEYETRQSLIKNNQKKEEKDNETWRKEQIEKLNEHHRNLEQDDKRSAMQRQMDTVQYNLDLQKIIIAAKIQQKQIEEKYNREIEESNREYRAKINEQTKEANAKRLNDDIRSLQSYSQIVSNNLQYQPVKNEFGFMQVAKTNKVLRETLEGLLILRQKIIETRDEATRMWDAGDLSTDEYNNALSDLKNQMDGLEKKIKEVQDGLSWEGKLQDFFQNLQQYYSAVSDAFQNILAAFQESEDYMIERQMDALDKENEALQKKLEENEKILEHHKNNVDKIEGELSDARGDRRERLIDALNAEIIAQRRAQSEEEKLKKEEEKIQRQQEALDKKQRENEYKRGLQQILFNTAASISQASTTGWPMPAPIFMALAAAVGAAQYSLAKQRKPYAEGGILDGLSHENGGISVGNSNIEVEGGEYVINKRSTANNTELLNLINNSDRQLTPSDLMNFATNMSVSPLEVNMPESSSLETAFVAYAQRPIVVDVREITSRQESVRNVQVLSGIR